MTTNGANETGDSERWAWRVRRVEGENPELGHTDFLAVCDSFEESVEEASEEIVTIVSWRVSE